MLAFATLTTLLLAADPPQPKAALVFMQVESPTEKDATALLEESLRHAFSTRMSVITCKEAIQDETALKKVLEDRGIKSSADAPKKVGLLTDFSRYGCEIPSEGPLWAAWLTAYADSRSRRREVSLRMRNLRDEKSTPTFASLAEPEDHHLSWSELVERCVRRYFEEEDLAEIQIAPTARIQVREPLTLQARLSVSSQDTEARDLGLHWKLYQCSERTGCDRFRAAVEEYVNCRRSNRVRSAADPSLTPLCVDPLETYDRVAVQRLADRSLPWIHWTEEPSVVVTVDIPGEYVLVASSRGDVAGAQSLTVEPPANIGLGFVGPAYKPQLDPFFLVGYDRLLFQTQAGYFGVGMAWGVRLGGERNPPPPFGARGLISPSLMLRRYFTADILGEAWVVPAGLLYIFNAHLPDGPGVYDLYVGTMMGLAVVWRPASVPALSFRAAVMGVTETFNAVHSEIYGPLVGLSVEL